MPVQLRTYRMLRRCQALVKGFSLTNIGINSEPKSAARRPLLLISKRYCMMEANASKKAKFSATDDLGTKVIL